MSFDDIVEFFEDTFSGVILGHGLSLRVPR